MDKTNIRQEDMKYVLKTTEKIFNRYSLLANLEQTGLSDINLYNSIRETIKAEKEIIGQIITKYPTNDDYMQELFEKAYSHEDDSVATFNFSKYFKINPADRIFEYIDELDYINHTFSKNFEDEDEDILEEIYYYKTQKVKGILKDHVKVEAKTLSHPTDTERDDLDYVAQKVTTFVFINYLEDAIKRSGDTETKKALIQFKYNVISNISFLEDAFLIGLDMREALDRSYEELFQVLSRYDIYYPIVVYHHVEEAQQLQNVIKYRQKIDFESKVDWAKDIVLGLMIKTHLSCIPNDQIRNMVINDELQEAEETGTYIDSTLLEKATLISKSYTRNYKA